MGNYFPTNADFPKMREYPGLSGIMRNYAVFASRLRAKTTAFPAQPAARHASNSRASVCTARACLSAEALLAKAEAPLSIGVWRFSGACELGRLVLFKNFPPNPHLRASSFKFFVPFWTLLVPF